MFCGTGKGVKQLQTRNRNRKRNQSQKPKPKNNTTNKQSLTNIQHTSTHTTTLSLSFSLTLSLTLAPTDTELIFYLCACARTFLSPLQSHLTYLPCPCRLYRPPLSLLTPFACIRVRCYYLFQFISQRLALTYCFCFQFVFLEHWVSVFLIASQRAYRHCRGACAVSD